MRATGLVAWAIAAADRGAGCSARFRACPGWPLRRPHSRAGREGPGQTHARQRWLGVRGALVTSRRPMRLFRGPHRLDLRTGSGSGRRRWPVSIRRHKGSVHGRFIRGGRLVVGRATGFGIPCCRRHISVRFRARLTGTPNAARPGLPSSCDPVTIFEIPLSAGTDSYELAEQGIGCTTARRLARQWHASPECAALSTPGTTCSLGAATCERIPRRSLAAARPHPMLHA